MEQLEQLEQDFYHFELRNLSNNNTVEIISFMVCY